MGRKVEILDSKIEAVNAGSDALNSAETYILAAQKHGEESHPDHEVGDLQAYFRVAFDMLTPEQKLKFWNHDDVQNTVFRGDP